ncbi:nucleotidyltransferase [Helicobacter didelphidarum]|uniref:Nucleotidyltransferase n=1 Tax=Helicobacter didelphidarum TaxID=2040648 RepID=A0A3D8IJ69_9HELI|nr:nucleotidyltransferase substrate binding protein [Helicobacter didelphidarum]RDU65272.1 nucleotidyltransferase [Helicobacter didelphidarum]
MDNDIRWKQRFEYFQRAFVNLDKLKDKRFNDFSELEREGIIQRFEVSIELSWKLMKDFLQNEGYEIKSPKESIRQAFVYGLISDAEAWIEALNRRNITSHTYDESGLNENVEYILSTFYPLMRDLYHTLKVRL